MSLCWHGITEYNEGLLVSTLKLPNANPISIFSIRISRGNNKSTWFLFDGRYAIFKQSHEASWSSSILWQKSFVLGLMSYQSSFTAFKILTVIMALWWAILRIPKCMSGFSKCFSCKYAVLFCAYLYGRGRESN